MNDDLADALAAFDEADAALRDAARDADDGGTVDAVMRYVYKAWNALDRAREAVEAAMEGGQ